MDGWDTATVGSVTSTDEMGRMEFWSNIGNKSQAILHLFVSLGETAHSQFAYRAAACQI